MSPKSKSDPENPPMSSSDRTLRIVTVLTFEWALAFLIPHGVLSHDACPALGLVPMFLSASFGLVHSCKTVKSRPLDDKIDAFIATFLIYILIPGWVFIADEWDTSLALVGAYGTMPLMINFCIHTYFAARKHVSSMLQTLFKNILEPQRCPHCQSRTKTNWRKATRQGSVHSHESEERYRDDPDADVCDDEESVVSVSSSRKTAKQNAAPLFKAPREDDDEDPAILV